MIEATDEHREPVSESLEVWQALLYHKEDCVPSNLPRQGA